MSVVTYTGEKREENHIHEVCLEENDSQRASWKHQQWIRVFNDLAINLIVVVMSVLGVFMWFKGMASVGDVVMIFTVTASISQAVRGATKDMVDVSELIGDMKNAISIIGVPHDITDRPKAKKLEKVVGHVAFKDVTFTYPGNTDSLFNGLNMDIKPGQRVALVGASGSGKSTLVKLLLRMYETQRGAVLVDGKDIKDVTLESLRDHIAVVTQEPNLFHRSLAENIHYGRPSASMEEVYEAARLANADEFIETLPDGYDTLVGERGVKLSGGQKQRVVIARAILKDAPILVFDEATSSLDSESEHLIQEALEPLMHDRTVIAIAHRLSTIKAFDRILVFSEGVLVEDGTHTELVTKGGVYANLWNIQSGGFFPQVNTTNTTNPASVV